MIRALTVLIGCQLAGEIITQATGLPLPGPVIGMVILLGLFIVRDGVPTDIDLVSRGLLQHLSLLFVPAGVGIMVQLDLLAADWLPITAALIGSTVLSLLVTALVMQRLAKPEDEP
ncbi:MAG TPA: CidA/LrgA family protein [Stellaceae bacterium]|nr:CidA/LrgA family protein [Stellaceae bacterium]